jgi:hypothetical protein
MIIKFIFQHKIPELVVEYELIFSFDHYDLCPATISESSNPILAEEKTHIRAREQPPSRIPAQNMDEDDEEEE